MKTSTVQEEKEQELFDKIAERYAGKDIYPVSKKARKYRVESLFDLISRVLNVTHFGNVLELGCGHGANSRYIENHYDNYVGIDYSKELIRLAKSRYGSSSTNFLCQNIKDFKSDNTFDLIFGIGVLHHVNDIDRVLQALLNVSHGKTIYAFIEVQNGNFLVQFLRRIREIFDKKYSGDQHVFSRQELINIFERNKFHVNGVAYEGYFSPPFAEVMLRPAFIFVSLSSLVVTIDSFLGKRIDSKFAWNIRLVATNTIS